MFFFSIDFKSPLDNHGLCIGEFIECLCGGKQFLKNIFEYREKCWIWLWRGPSILPCVKASWIFHFFSYFYGLKTVTFLDFDSTSVSKEIENMDRWSEMSEKNIPNYVWMWLVKYPNQGCWMWDNSCWKYYLRARLREPGLAANPGQVASPGPPFSSQTLVTVQDGPLMIISN